MRKLGILVVTAAVLALTGCAAALLGSAAGSGYSSSEDGRSASRITEDGSITSAVKANMTADRDTKTVPVNVTTYEGVVTLRGEVRTAAQRTAAERVARSTKGVKSVRNELRVRS